MGKKTLLVHFYTDFYRFSKISEFVYVTWGEGGSEPVLLHKCYMGGGGPEKRDCNVLD